MTDMWSGSRYKVPKACGRDFELKKMLGAGAYGEVYNACKDSNCSYAVKVIPILGDTTEKSFNEEVKISTLIGDGGVGPKVYMSWICEWKDHGGPYNLGMMLMDKLDITLFDYYLERKTKRQPINEDLLRDLFRKKVEKMVSLGYIHRDTYSSNIMLNLDSNKEPIDLFIIDWGFVDQIQNKDEVNANEVNANEFNTNEIANKKWYKIWRSLQLAIG